MSTTGVRLPWIALWIALGAEAAWIAVAAFAPRPPLHAMLFAGAVSAGFALLAATRGRWRPLAGLARGFLGYDFLSSVADRFGLYGPPGTHGVVWGDYAHFVVSTRVINGFLPASFAPALAALATLAELCLGTTLLLGLGARLAARGAALLLLVFGLAMTVSLGFGAQAAFAVFVLAAGAWALASVDPSWMGLDALRAQRRAVQRRADRRA